MNHCENCWIEVWYEYIVDDPRTESNNPSPSSILSHHSNATLRALMGRMLLVLKALGKEVRIVEKLEAHGKRVVLEMVVCGKRTI